MIKLINQFVLPDSAFMRRILVMPNAKQK